MSGSIDRQAAIDALEKDKASLDNIIKSMSAMDVRLDHYVAQHNQVDYDIDTIKNLPTAEPQIIACGKGELPDINVGDMISRQQAIDYFFRPYSNEEVYTNSDIREALLKLPSAEPQRGKWTKCDVFLNQDNTIEEWQQARCSVCGKYHTTPYMYYFDRFNYCPNCGADMREVTE